MPRYKHTAYKSGVMDDGRLMIAADGEVWSTDSWRDITPLLSLRRRDADNVLILDRKRDFGGCGKDAMKLEVGVTFRGWLAEIDARKEECAFCESPAVEIDLAPVCQECFCL